MTMASCDAHTSQNAAGRPRVSVDTMGVQRNVEAVVAQCRPHRICVAGVTKGGAGNPAVAQAMLDGGADMLADARIQNLRRLRDAGCDATCLLLRSPSLIEMDEAVAVADMFLMSDLISIQALSAACLRNNTCVEVIIMVELGDLREGVMPTDLPEFVGRADALDRISIVGIGGNHACNLGVMPNDVNMAQLSALADQVQTQLGRPLKYVSAGNSSAFTLAQDGKLPSNINHLRLGEALLLGRETTGGERIEGTRPDSFELIAQIIELTVKTALGDGPRGLNSLGKETNPDLSGPRQLALLNVGAVDTEISGLTPCDPRVRIIGGSSDHLVVDTTELDEVKTGDELGFRLSYHALTTAMSSPYLLHAVNAGRPPLNTMVAHQADHEKPQT